MYIDNMGKKDFASIRVSTKMKLEPSICCMALLNVPFRDLHITCINIIIIKSLYEEA